jgi:mono/diheme cytochrome c family protein
VLYTSRKQLKSFSFPLLIACVVLASVSPVRSQEQPSKAKIKKVPAEYTSETSGPKLYQRYCAACHGKDGKGNGPAAAALKAPPPDLTLLAKNNGGKFPSARVNQDLSDPTQAPHGSKDMPIWGELFRQIGPSSEFGQVRARTVTDYLKSIQER